MKNDLHMNEKKLLTVGRQGIRVRHFTTDITNLPFVMDANCFMVFSHLWRRYLSACSNESLITDDDWFQFPMKSLTQLCGFKDKGTLQRAVEGLYRSGVIDVRVESGKRLWACWKMNKNALEKIASMPDRYVMVEPYLKYITSIESKDKNFTYMVKKDGLDKLGEFFGVKMKEEKPPNIVENPPLFNTIIQEHINTSKLENCNILTQNHSNTSKQNHDITTEQEHDSTSTQQNHTDAVEDNNEDFNLLLEEVKENQNESKSEIESSSDSNPFQPIVNNQLSPRENEEVEKAFRTLEFCKPSIDTNTLKNCLDLLHEVSQSNRETYMDSLSKAHSRFKLLLADYTKEEAKPFTKTLNELSSVLGEAFRKNDTKQK